MAAHELKAPLSAIKGYVELLIDRTLGETLESYKQQLDRSRERIDALVSLINDLLNISRMEAGTIRRDIEPIDLSNLLTHTVEFFHTDMDKRSLTLDSSIEPNLVMDADREEIQRVFTNLISNAIKYNKENGKITVNAQRDNGYIRVQIADTGIGLKPEEKEHLFEEFFRAKNPLTRNITGTGLGLTILKKIVDSYAGRIEVESEFESGSTFTVILPTNQIN
jgi:signal transduction histidine kinase